MAYSLGFSFWSSSRYNLRYPGSSIPQTRPAAWHCLQKSEVAGNWRRTPFRPLNREEMILPRMVRGPVDFWAFAALAASRLGVMVGRLQSDIKPSSVELLVNKITPKESIISLFMNKVYC